METHQDSRMEFILECRRMRLSYRAIAEMLGVTKQRIHQIVGAGNAPKLPKLKQTINAENLRIWNKRKLEHLGLPTPHGKFGDGVNRIREIVRMRDNHTCQKCLKRWDVGTRRFDVHHLDQNKESSRDVEYDKKNLEKLITLCHACHIGLHEVRVKMMGSREK